MNLLLVVVGVLLVAASFFWSVPVGLVGTGLLLVHLAHARSLNQPAKGGDVR